MAVDHGVCYADSIMVQRALDWAEPAGRTPQILRALETGTRAVEGLCNRTFYPWTGNIPFDWPNPQRALPWRLWLDHHSLLSVTQLKVGTTILAATDFYLRPDWGPPYNYVELNRATVGGFFGTGSLSPQRQISITGVWGYDLQEDPAGTLAAPALATDLTFTVSDSNTIGAGALLRCGTERVTVTSRAMLTTGLTVAAPGLTATAAGTTLNVSGAGLVAGETVLIDSERLTVTDLVGTVATVRRAVDATVLAVHNAGAVINAPRLLTVTRGALGTTAAAQSNGAALQRHAYPSLIVQLTLAEAMLRLSMELRGFTVGRQSTARGGLGDIPEIASVQDIRDQVFDAYGRTNRIRAV